MPFMTKPASGGAVKTPARRPAMWGDPGVSERLIVKDADIDASPRKQGLTLEDAGILSMLSHHVYADDLTVTHGTGTNAKDVFGPYSLINWYSFLAGGNTPLMSMSGKSLGVLQIIEYPGRSYEADAVPASVIDPLTNASDLFAFPATTGQFRFWFRVPLALRWAGMPGGAVGYVVLQNKKVANVIKPVFNLTGAAAPYTVGTGNNPGDSAYLVTGDDTVTGSPVFETWKHLHSVPTVRSAMPLFGFVRYIQEFSQAYAGSQMKYSLEPGGMLLRAIVNLYDATAKRGIATANVQDVVYQYGVNKEAEVYSAFRNILEQADLYGRALPQGHFALDWYTAKRSLVDAKSTENTANVKIVVDFASGYAPPANSMAYILLDKIYVARTRQGQ